MAIDKDSFFGDVVILSIGRISKNWSLDANDGLVYANDASTLGADAHFTKITMVCIKDDDGELTDEIVILTEGRREEFTPENDDVDSHIASSIRFIKPWEKKDIARLIGAAKTGSRYRLSYQNSEHNVGEGGELRIDSADKDRAVDSLVVNITCYRDVSSIFAPDLPNAVDLSGFEPEDSEEFCGILWHPTSSELKDEIAEADDYFKEYDNSLAEHINFLEKWKTLELPEVAAAWQFVLDNLDKDEDVAQHMSAATFALTVAANEKLFRELVDSAIRMSRANPENSVLGFSAICNTLASVGQVAHRDEIYRLMEEAVGCARVDSDSDICLIINTMCGLYQGTRFGDKDFGVKAIESVTSRITDSKVRTKIKKSAQQALDDA